MARSEFHGVSDQRKAAFKRLRDAKALLAEENSLDWLRSDGAHARGAMYLAGYAIECRLKSIAMETYGCQTLAQLAVRWQVDEGFIYTHGLEGLAKRLPLWIRLRRSEVWADFSKVIQWRPAWRYDPLDWPNREASRFLLAVTRVYDWLGRNH